MSMDVHPTMSVSSLTFFAQIESDGENQDLFEETVFSSKESFALKTESKEYQIKEQVKIPLSSKEICECLSTAGFSKKLSPSHQRAKEKSEILKKQLFFQLDSAKPTKNPESGAKTTPLKTLESGFKVSYKANHGKDLKNEAAKTRETKDKSLSREENSNNSPSRSVLSFRAWSCHQTKEFWENRTTFKEPKDREQSRDQRRQDSDEQNGKEERRRVQKIGKPCSFAQDRDHDAHSSDFEKPILERPKTGIFALYYILTKIGIFSDGSCNWAYKKEIEYIDAEMTAAYKHRHEEIKKALEKEESARRWSIAEKIYSWMGSLLGIIAGTLLIATGVGAITGAMMIAAGIIQITNQILEMTNGWQKIAELLPGEDHERKRAVISWIQIGIAVLSLILAGAGLVGGKLSSFWEAIQTAQTALSVIASTAYGITTIGQGVTSSQFKDKLAEIKRHEKRLAQLKHQREDLMAKIDIGVDHLEQLFEDLSRALEFEVELFRADTMINRG